MYLAHLEKLNRTRLADVLVEEGVLDRARVEEAQAEQDSSGKQLGQILIEGEVLTDYDLAKIVVTHYSLPYLDVASYSMRREVVELLPLEFRQKWAIQPLDSFGSILTLAVTEIPAPEQIEEIVDATHLTPILFIAARRAVLNTIEEEKKRANLRPASKAAPKHATVAQPVAAAPVAAPPKTGPVTVAPSAAAPAAPESLLPDFDLPTVSMKLASAAPAARPAPVKGAPVAAKPPTAAAGKPGPGGALNWMDAAGKPGAAANDHAAKAAKFSKPGAQPPAPAAARPGSPPAKGPLPAAPAKPASPAAGAWQSIFDTADESVKKPKQ